MKLHLGCGGTRKEGYVNVDAKTAVAADVKCNVMDLEKHFICGTIDEIYSSHMFEHLDRKESIKFLDICVRLLKKGGILFLAIPCIDYLVDGWKDGSIPDERFIAALYGLHRDPYDYHKMGYTIQMLIKVLESKGFVIDKQARGRPGYGPQSAGLMVWARKK